VLLPHELLAGDIPQLLTALFVCRIQFNIVCKHLGAERMSFFLNEAAGDVRDILMPSLEPPKAKL
jgi:hypothetical protein